MIGRFSELGLYRELARSRELYRVALGGFFGLVGYFAIETGGGAETWGRVLLLTSLGINGVPIVWGALKGLVQRRVNVDELVSLAIISSVWQGELVTAVVVGFVMVLGAFIEQVTSGAARRAIQGLIDIHPETATIIEGGRERTVPSREVSVGDMLLVKPGDRIPVDGIIRRGLTAVDESPMTGEPIPREKTVGNSVYAGTLNQTGVIEIEARTVGPDTTLGKIIRLVSTAEEYKPRTVRIIDRYASWFTPAILLCAGIAWALTWDASRAVTVLIVGCPCALILAAPTAIVAAIGRAAKAGILVKGGAFLEEAARVNVILFDKTGTLTRGEPSIATIVAVDGVDTNEVLARAASAEQDSTHPLARAVLRAARYAKVTLSRADDMVAEIGLGVRACVNGHMIEVGSTYLGGGSIHLPLALQEHVALFKELGVTPLVVYEDRRPLGVVAISDSLRPSARDTVDKLKALRIERIGMLSGDHEKSVRRVANEAGLTDAWHEQKPHDKLNIIRDFQNAGKIVAFVGDGINDAPALAAAHIGIAMGAAGTDVALETADVALMHDDIGKIPFLIALGRTTLATIKWNIGFGLAFNVVAVFAGGLGLLSPIMGAIVHNVGSVLVVLSSAHISFIKET